MGSSVNLPRKRPTQARSRATFDAILEAAAQLLEQHGYAGATTNRVAERAGMSIGLVLQAGPDARGSLASTVN
ncbi:MAG: AcrR family transcriptional regulator [Myxococcota bacterium]|jgi:AcrR family transcriptional regulator